MQYLFLHGWGFRNTIWHDFTGMFANNPKVITPCLYELAAKSTDKLFSSMACELSDLLNEDTIVIAWSIGGLVATELEKINQHIKVIVFIASTPCFINKQNWQNVIEEKGILNLEKKLLKNTTSGLEYFSGLVAHGDISVKETIKIIKESLAEESHREMLLSWLAQMRETDQRKMFSKIKTPATMIYGEKDSLISSNIVNEIKQLNPKVSSAVIKDCGHAPFISNKTQTSDIINEFINATVN